MFQLFKEEKQIFANSRIFLEDLLRVRSIAAPHITDQQVSPGDLSEAKHLCCYL